MTTKPLLIIPIIVFGTFVSNINGQSIKDYFLPDSAHNKTYLFNPAKNGESTGKTRVVNYIKSGNNYDIIDTDMDKGQYNSSVTRTVQVSDTDVEIIHSVVSSAGVKDEEKDYDPPVVLIKIPTKGQTAHWTTIDMHGIQLKCISTWINVTINGEKRQVIKVISQQKGWDGTSVDYYAKGRGLWKVEFESSKGEITPVYKFDRIEFDPDLK